MRKANKPEKKIIASKCFMSTELFDLGRVTHANNNQNAPPQTMNGTKKSDTNCTISY